MAAYLKVGGYQCKFIDEVPDDFLCKSCTHVARQPHLTSCCGEQFCHTCIAAILQDKKPCPSCKEDTFITVMNKRDHQRILALRVCCMMKERGCQWTGMVEQLDTHVDENTGDCQYVDVECPEKCGQQVQKHQLATHIANEFRGHLEQKDRQIKEVEERLQQLVREKAERMESMQKSLQKEQKEGEQQLQQQLEQKERQINHIQKKLQEQEQKHQERDNKVQEELREKQKQIEALKEQIIQGKQDHEDHIKAVEQQIKQVEQQVERIGKQLKEKEQELEQLNMKVQAPLHFTMSNFNHLKTEYTVWSSPPMYTHPNGYKFCIGVDAYGYKGAQVSVSLRLLPGEFDATLQWPAKFTITLQLLNQYRDQDHIPVTYQFQWQKPEREREGAGWFTEELIAHTDLELNAQKQTQYLKDDCLHFRITKIEAQK